jgi:membrane associated rhomboid family serine protease
MNRFFIPSLSFHNSAHQLAIAMIAASVINAIFGSMALLFLPHQTISGLELWRPFTALLIAVTPMEIIFGALIIYTIGGGLESSWGRNRFFFVALAIPFIAELITLLFFLALPSAPEMPYHGASMILSTIWIAYGLRAAFSRQLLNFWGAPIKGETFALIGLGFVVLSALFSSYLVVLPDLIAAGLTYLYMYKRSVLNFAEVRRRVELAYYNRKLKRLKNKAGLHIVKRDEESKDRYH